MMVVVVVVVAVVVVAGDARRSVDGGRCDGGGRGGCCRSDCDADGLLVDDGCEPRGCCPVVATAVLVVRWVDGAGLWAA